PDRGSCGGNGGGAAGPPLRASARRDRDQWTRAPPRDSGSRGLSSSRPSAEKLRRVTFRAASVLQSTTSGFGIGIRQSGLFGVIVPPERTKFSRICARCGRKWLSIACDRSNAGPGENSSTWTKSIDGGQGLPGPMSAKFVVWWQPEQDCVCARVTICSGKKVPAPQVEVIALSMSIQKFGFRLVLK